MKFIITRAYISAVFAVVLPFLSLSAFADCFEDGFNAGLDACPTKCDTCPPDRYNEGFNAGKSACRNDPASCGIQSDDGINCQNAASSCGLFSSNDVTPAGITKGKQECIQNIVQCVSVSEPEAIKSALNQIVSICKDDPYLCFGASEPPALPNDVVFCEGEDKNCLKQVEPKDFKLHLPVVYYLQDNESAL
ncbi:MAG: hypothetical protein ABFS56_29595, partial [Pseudomonadota bacterium]